MKKYDASRVQWKQAAHPGYEENLIPVTLTDETIRLRKEKVLSIMTERGFECLCVYGDLEHGSNFEYLTGFLPRFEEALLVLHANGNAWLILGNENVKMADYSRIRAKVIHSPYFSLPNQPMEHEKTIKEIMMLAGIKPGMHVGVAGWKLFTGICQLQREQKQMELFEVPHYIIEGIREAAGPEGQVSHGTEVFIDPGYGARVVNNANEISHYAFGSALSGDCMLKAMDHLEPGITEMEAAGWLAAYGQPRSVVTICATGERFVKANLYPSARPFAVGDRISLTTGFKGGLTSRAGYGVSCREELKEGEREYLSAAAAPYFTAISAWLEEIQVGMTGGELYGLMEQVLPKEQYHWSLNPGHLTADEEWMSSPVYPGSELILKSGMLLQIDIIPSVPGFGGTGAESGIALADEALRNTIETEYPELWRDIIRRRTYIKEVLHIQLGDDVLPLSNLTGYYRPFFFAKDHALVMENK